MRPLLAPVIDRFSRRVQIGLYFLLPALCVWLGVSTTVGHDYWICALPAGAAGLASAWAASRRMR